MEFGSSTLKNTHWENPTEVFQTPYVGLWDVLQLGGSP